MVERSSGAATRTAVLAPRVHKQQRQIRGTAVRDLVVENKTPDGLVNQRSMGDLEQKQVKKKDEQEQEVRDLVTVTFNTEKEEEGKKERSVSLFPFPNKKKTYHQVP